MHLLLPIASILGIEVEDLIERFKQNAIAWSAMNANARARSSSGNRPSSR